MNEVKKILEMCSKEYINGTGEENMENVIALYGVILLIKDCGEKELRDTISEHCGYIEEDVEEKILKARKIIEKLK